jgi:hypothetical protein
MPRATSPYQLVRTTAIFEKTDELFTLDYENPTPETADLRIRFLQFAIQGVLFRDPNFWQPSAGTPFFQRTPVLEEAGICAYRGCAVRGVPIEGGKLGICVDIKQQCMYQGILSS